MDPFEMGLMLMAAAKNPALAAQLDQAGVPPPMGLGGPKGAGGPLVGAGDATGPTTDLGALIKGFFGQSTPLDNQQPVTSPHAIPRPPEAPQPIGANPGWAGGAPVMPMAPFAPEATTVPQAGPSLGGWEPTVTPSMAPPIGVGATGLPGNQPGAAPGDDIVAAALAAEAAKGAQPGGDIGRAISGLSGLVAPKPVTPIMNGGVTGGVNPPKVDTAGLKQGSPAIQALVQALMQKSAGPIVPDLGSLIMGKGGIA